MSILATSSSSEKLVTLNNASRSRGTPSTPLVSSATSTSVTLQWKENSVSAPSHHSNYEHEHDSSSLESDTINDINKHHNKDLFNFQYQEQNQQQQQWKDISEEQVSYNVIAASETEGGRSYRSISFTITNLNPGMIYR